MVRATQDIEPQKRLLVPHVASEQKLSTTKAMSLDDIVVTVQSKTDSTIKTLWANADFSRKSDAEISKTSSAANKSRSLFWAGGHAYTQSGRRCTSRSTRSFSGKMAPSLTSLIDNSHLQTRASQVLESKSYV